MIGSWIFSKKFRIFPKLFFWIELKIKLKSTLYFTFCFDSILIWIILRLDILFVLFLKVSFLCIFLLITDKCLREPSVERTKILFETPALRLSIYLFVYLSTLLSIYQPTLYLPSIFINVYLLNYSFNYLHIYVAIYLVIHLFSSPF